MEFIKFFESINKHDALSAGGKGASLGEMTQAGIPVPPGFVVLSSSFERFLEETDLGVEIDAILHGVDVKMMHTVEHASETIQKLILEADIPEDIREFIRTSYTELGATFVAVRSSATAEDSASAAWAGQLDSFLNTTEETLLTNVQRCWASLFTPRAIFYRFEQGLHDSKISVAVVVQKMVESEVSGIAFSVHPVTEDRNQLIIEAGFGLGEAIVSGQITPDSYVVSKNPRRIMDMNVNTQIRALYRVGEAGGNEWRDIPEPKASSQVLTDSQILELSEIILGIENHYGFPCDIEWAYEACPNTEGGRAGKFYIVQSRPITTLATLGDVCTENDEWIFMWAAAPVLPSFYAMADAQMNRRDILSEFPHTSFQYYDGSALTNYMPRSEIEETKRGSKDLFTSSDRYNSYVKTFEEEYVNWWKWVREIEQKDYAHASRAELLEDHLRFTEYQRDALGHFATSRPEPNFAIEQELERILKQKFSNTWPERFGLLTAPFVLDDIQKQQLELARLVEKKNLSDTEVFAHASQFPWLVFGQFDDTKVFEYVRHLIEAYDGLPFEQAVEKQKIEKENVKHEQDVLLASLGHEAIEAKHFATVLQEHAVRRMDIKAFWIGSYFLTRNLWKKMATELGVDIWDFFKYLMPSEVNLFLKNESEKDIHELIAKRTSSYAIICDGTNINVLSGSEADQVFRETVHQNVSDGKEIKGQTAVLGRYTGKVHKVMPSDLDSLKKSTTRFQNGDVLVTTMTQPNMLPIMKKAGAVVADEGGITSHAAIVAREFKTPCIVGCLNAMQVLKNGDLVEVDADNGVVRVIERKEGKLYEGDWVTMKSSISPLIIGYNVDSWVDVSVSRYGTYAPLKKMLALVKDSGNIGAVAVLKDEYVSSAQYLLEHRDTLDSIFKDFENDEEKFFVLLEAFENHTRDIKENFDAFLDAYYAMYSSGIMFDGFLMYSDTLVEQIKQDHSQSLDEDIRTLTKTPGLTFSQKEEYGIIRIALASEAERENLLSAHAKRFHWVLNNYKNVSRVPESYFKERIAGLCALERDVLEAKHKECEEYERVHEEAVTSVRAKNVLNKEAIETLLLLGKIGWYVDRRKALNLAGNYWIGEYISRMCIQCGIREKDALLLLPEEFSAVVSGYALISDFNLEERQNEFGMVFGHGSHRAVLGSEFVELKNVIEPKVDIETSELKGNVAYRGVVRGRVKVLNFVNEKSFEENEVLVTSMTRPDFVPLMKKACAIITDEGGVTSHAAIIARELKKPCIIGTKIATQVLKDGDLVEVDADNGVVRVLERTNIEDGFKEKLHLIDWEKLIKREMDLFLFSSAFESNSDLMKNVFGFGFRNILVNYIGTKGTLFHSAKELKESKEYFQGLIENEDCRLNEWFAQEKKLRESEVPEEPLMLIEYFQKVLLFSTLLPTRVLFAIEGEEKFQHLVSFYEEMRSRGTYPLLYQDKIKPLLNRVAKEHGLPEELSGYLTVGELKNLLYNKCHVTEFLLKERKNGCALYLSGGEIGIVNTTIKIDTEKRNEIIDNKFSGEVAFGGKSRGLVRIVNTIDQMKEFNEGEILVSISTNPSLIMAIKRASAIITDEGGIISHAAIVARELKKPCIIGTKIATQVLHDGDLVEVDADNGVVRVLERVD
jgi:phosphoenolpyruvate synthase/pyruvate phosphate dikinase